MQDTNITNTISTTPSSLQKEKAAAITPPVVKVQSVISENPHAKPHYSLVQRILKFLSKLFSGKKRKLHKAEPVIEIVVAHQEPKQVSPVEEQVQKMVSTVAAAQPVKTQSGAVTENTLRKIAERQFVNMDVSQVTRN